MTEVPPFVHDYELLPAQPSKAMPMNSPTISDVERARELLEQADGHGFATQAECEQALFKGSTAIAAIVTALSAQKSEREALEEAKQAFDSIYHYTFDHAVSDGELREYIRTEASDACCAIVKALSAQPEEQVGECDLCQGTGRNAADQLWPDHPPACRACNGSGKASATTTQQSVREATKQLRDAADWLVGRADHHGNYAAVDQNHIDGLRDAVRSYDASLGGSL